MKGIFQLLVLLMMSATHLSGYGYFSVWQGSSNSDAGLYTDNEMLVGGEIRTYDYYIPNDLGNQPRPLVFLLHGGGSSPDDLTGLSGFKAPYIVWMDIAEREKVILVYPKGSVNALGRLGWNDCRGDAFTNPTVDDAGFIDALIDNFSSQYKIDRNRVYASGTSNGGHMSLRLALELSHRFAAVAAVVAAMPADSSCDRPIEPVSVLFMNGTADPVLPYLGGEVAPMMGGRGTVLSTQASVNYWRVVNRTNRIPHGSDLPDINRWDGSRVRYIKYDYGRNDTDVVLYNVIGGGHLEPSIKEKYSALLEYKLGKQNHDMEMAREIWQFFKSKTARGQATAIHETVD